MYYLCAMFVVHHFTFSFSTPPPGFTLHGKVAKLLLVLELSKRIFEDTKRSTQIMN